MRRMKIRFRRHEHWFAEWWSMVFLSFIGFYGLCAPEGELLRSAYLHGFLHVLPDGIWQCLFIANAALQCVALYRESLCLRAVSAFIATTLLIWGGLNVLVYGARWYFALIAWGVFATINFCALSRILTGIERKARGKVL